MRVPDFSAFDLVLEPVPDFENWFQGPVMDWEQGKVLAARMRASPTAREHPVLVGMLDDEVGHRIYVTPPLPPCEVVRDFGVGGHGGHSAESADREIGERLEAAHHLCPFLISFADSAGLHAEFVQPLDEHAAIKIDQTFTADEDAFNIGLESYWAGWTGAGPLMAPSLVTEQGLRLWWD